MPSAGVKTGLRAQVGEMDLMLKRFQNSLSGSAEAKLAYQDGEFQIIKPGTFVRCAVTGDPIRLDDLRYWSVSLQEPYKSAEISLKRHIERNREK
jgi:hypothetical protein